MSEWQPIETAPKDGTTVILWAGSWPCPDSGYFIGEGYSYWVTWWFGLLDKKGSEPTHWMPFPTPPKPTLTE